LSETDSPCDLSVLELGSGSFPCLVEDAVCDAFSDSGTGSDWFDAGLAPKNVPDEDWSDASAATAGVSIGVVASTSFRRRGSGGVSYCSRGHSRGRVLEDGASSRGRSPVRRRSSSRKPHGQKSRRWKSAAAKELLASPEVGASSAPHDIILLR
jgi:hypothetical protein